MTHLQVSAHPDMATLAIELSPQFFNVGSSLDPFAASSAAGYPPVGWGQSKYARLELGVSRRTAGSKDCVEDNIAALISEQFRPAPRTCLKVCGRLSLRPINWAVVLEDGPCRLVKIIGRWLIGLHSSPLGALPPASHKRYSHLGWSIWRSLLGSVNRQQCGKIPLASEISWPAGSIGWRYVAAGGSPRGRGQSDLVELDGLRFRETEFPRAEIASPESPRSASGKRDSSAQRQTAQNRLQARNGLRRDRNAAARARQLRALWPVSGKSSGSKDCVCPSGPDAP